MQIAENIARTDIVYYFDLELSDKQFQLRYTDKNGNMYHFPENLYRVSIDRNALIAQNETPYLLYVKGILLFEKKQYDNAIVEFNKIIAKNSDLLAEANAKIGDCYFTPAQVIVEENSKLAIVDTKYAANEDKIKELYKTAEPFYKKAKELKPDNKQLWGNYLLNIYWKLNKADYEALEKELSY